MTFPHGTAKGPGDTLSEAQAFTDRALSESSRRLKRHYGELTCRESTEATPSREGARLAWYTTNKAG